MRSNRTTKSWTNRPLENQVLKYKKLAFVFDDERTKLSMKYI